MLKLYDCRVPRRGKAAKGTVNVKMFGEPILDADGIARDFKVSEAVLNKPIEMVIAEVRAAMTVSDAILGIAMLDGLNNMNRSETAKDQNEVGLLANVIFANGLATDKDEAIRLASGLIPKIRFTAEAMVDAGVYDTIEEAVLVQTQRQLEKRKAFVAELKAAGQWSSKPLPRLVKAPVASTSDSQESETVIK